MPFEVQTAIGNDWENCWTVDGKPQYFPTREAAQAAIDEHLADVKVAVAAGDMSDEYDPEDYRIVEVLCV